MKLALICCLFSFAVSSLGQTGSKSRNIFDDGWEPPKRPAATQPAQPKPVPEPVTPPITPSVTPAVTRPSILPAVIARRTIPKPAEQAAVRKIMKEVYTEQLRDTSPAGRQKLTKALLDQAEKLASDAPTDEFVLLTAAVDAGVGASSLPMAFLAADRLAKVFDVDGLGVKAEAVARFKSALPAGAAENVRATIALADELEAADDLPTAIRVCTALQPVVASIPDLRTQLVARIRELNTAKETVERVGRDREKLKSSPDDPAANLAVGRYECFIKGRWDGGLELLAKGSDPALKAAAQAELNAGEKPALDVVIRLADAWWDVAATQSDARSQAAIKAHAAGFYQLGIKETTGLRRAQIEKRLAEVPKPSGIVVNTKPGPRKPRTIDLMPLFNHPDGIVAGQWTRAQGVMVPDGTKNARLQSSYRPPAQYDFLVEFSRHKAAGSFVLLLSRGDKSFEWMAGGSMRLSNIDGHARNGTEKKAPAGLQDGNRHTTVVQVRNAGMKMLVDGKEVLDYPTDYSNLSRNGLWSLKDDRCLGVGVWDVPVHIHRAEVIEVE